MDEEKKETPRKSRGKTVGALKRKGNTLLISGGMKHCAKCYTKIRRGPCRVCPDCLYEYAIKNDKVVDIYPYCYPGKKNIKNKKYLIPTFLKENQTCKLYFRNSWPNLVIVTKRQRKGVTIYSVREIIHTYSCCEDHISMITEKNIIIEQGIMYGEKSYESKGHIRY